MVNHEVLVQGISLTGVAQERPAVLQMNNEDFPARFLTDLGASTVTPGSSITGLATSPTNPIALYQPVQRILHLGLIDLSCNTVGMPRLDPTRVDSAGLVIRRVVRTNGVDNPDACSAWMRSNDGQFQWVPLNKLQEREDPDPTKRPQLKSGQAALDNLLSAQSLLTARTETWTPAFVAAPAVCAAAGRTLVYAVIPTASSDVTTSPPTPPQYDPQTLASSLPTLLQAGGHSPILAGQAVTYQYMSDDYAIAHSASSFQTFSLTLRMLYTVFGAFDNTPQAQALIAALNKHLIYSITQVGSVPVEILTPMGAFYQSAAAALIDYDPASGQPVPSITMPNAWDGFSSSDAAEILAALTSLLQTRSSQVLAPMGRFQDATRLYRMRFFLRIKSHTAGCAPKLVWSKPSDPFRIAAWHESGGRSQPPVPLPDPTDRNFLKNAKPNCSFAVPAGLMNAMQGTKLSDLSSGSAGPPGSGIQLNWICGFNIPLITICAFFVLNIFLILLNMIFFWLPFIKICIPFPLPNASNSGDQNGS